MYASLHSYLSALVPMAVLNPSDTNQSLSLYSVFSTTSDFDVSSMLYSGVSSSVTAYTPDNVASLTLATTLPFIAPLLTFPPLYESCITAFGPVMEPAIPPATVVFNVPVAVTLPVLYTFFMYVVGFLLLLLYVE